MVVCVHSRSGVYFGLNALRKALCGEGKGGKGQSGREGGNVRPNELSAGTFRVKNRDRPQIAFIH